ncbi:MAG TPA: type II secretion system protein [Methylomirabilota bacterium]|jgi:prepilin-type N-terminal cleavage/methylation domain-containing protein|nr:type II secretion system protein [Methylomirabilota bacterium]
MKRRAAGFSLIEVLVAMALFMIAATAISSLMYHSTAVISQNNYLSQAIACAQGALEEIRTQAYEDIADTAGQTCTGDGANFNVAWEVSENEPGDGMKKIVVTVSWLEKGASKSYAIETVYTKITA